MSSYQFPPHKLADENGLLALGGDLNPLRLIAAYQNGIFPWYSEGEIIQWYSPDPRFVLYPQELKVSKSMLQMMKKKPFSVTENQAFKSVINNCAATKRKDQDGTWITDNMIDSYCQLHCMGIAHSVEVWSEEQLVGGFYGLRMGSIFFGESMFSKESNSSKYGFITYVQNHQKELTLIDCQAHTQHLESLGARMIKRNEFLKILKNKIQQ